ncbi:MAG TPA: nitrate reductase cytochrome c-type subunit [Burkholderiaceae bacterium]
MRPALLLALALVVGVAAAQAPKFTDGLRGDTPIPGTTHPPRLGNWLNNDQRVTRNWDKQPPIVPHRVDAYQVDKNFNKCLDCHAREKSPFSQAIPVSETHYVDREGKVLDRISTRRYFCMQCHVAQEPVAPPVGNTFRGVHVAPPLAMP